MCGMNLPSSADATGRLLGEIRAEVARQRRTQVEIAELIGVTQVYVSRRLTGQVPLEVADLVDIARILGVSPQELLDRAGVGQAVAS